MKEVPFGLIRLQNKDIFNHARAEKIEWGILERKTQFSGQTDGQLPFQEQGLKVGWSYCQELKGRDGIGATPWKLNLVNEHHGQSRTDRKVDKDEKQERMWPNKESLEWRIFPISLQVAIPGSPGMEGVSVDR